MTKISPSVLAADFAYMADAIEKLEQAGADYIHCDVMDGRFVPNISFGAQMIEAIRRHTKLTLDVHLMIVEPQTQIENFAKAGADIITFHPEASFHPHKTLGDIHKAGLKAGIVLNPGTSVTSVDYLLPDCDMVLLMSVNPGWGGQKFIPDSLRKARELAARRKELGLNFEIEIDGGINENTAKDAIAAGVDVLVAGSSVFQSNDIAAAIKALRG